MDSFFETVAIVISTILRNLIQNTLDDLLNFLSDYLNGNYYELISQKQFRGILVSHTLIPIVIPLIPNVQEAKFYLNPDLNNLRSIVDKTIDNIVECLSDFPRIETLLFVNLNHKNLYLNMLNKNDQSIYSTKSKIKKVFEVNSFGPMNYQKTYEKYIYLLSSKCIEDTNILMLRKNQVLNDYRVKIEYFRNLINEIKLLPDKVYLNLYLLDCQKLNECLLERANQCIEIIVNKIMFNNLNLNKSICERFDKIVQTMTQYGETPEECVNLIKYVENARFYEVFQLKEKIYESAQNVLFLFDYAFLSKEDMKWNNYAFTWFDNIQPMLTNTESKLIKERDDWIAKVKDRRAKLSLKIEDCLAKVKDLRQKERISEAVQIKSEIDLINSEIEYFSKEVIRIYFILVYIYFFLNQNFKLFKKKINLEI